MSNNFYRRYGLVVNSHVPVAKAWEICLQIPMIKEDYLGQMAVWGLPYEYALTPHWAYWFARHVIMDHWPAAESLIEQDLHVLSLYNVYKSVCRSVCVLGKSTEEDQNFIVDDNGQIVGWKEGRKPVKRVAQSRLDDVADRISQRMSAFRKKKLLQGEDNDER